MAAFTTLVVILVCFVEFVTFDGRLQEVLKLVKILLHVHCPNTQREYLNSWFWRSVKSKNS